jgi:hypothetical protein
MSWISWAFGGIGVVFAAPLGRLSTQAVRLRSERRSIITDRSVRMELMSVLTETMDGRDYRVALREWKRKPKVERERTARDFLVRWQDPEWTREQFFSIPPDLIRRAAFMSYWEFSNDDENLTREMTRANFEAYLDWWSNWASQDTRLGGLSMCFISVI